MEWDSGLTVVHGVCPHLKNRATILVPLSLKLIAENANIGTEYMLYAKGRFLSDNLFIVLPEYCVPYQRATYSSVRVDFNRFNCGGYNVVIHKHPRGVKDFSSTDDEHINANNDASLLIEGGKIVRGVVRKKLPCGAYGIADADTILYLPMNEGAPSFEAETETADRVVSELMEKVEVEGAPSHTKGEADYVEYGRLRGEEDEEVVYEYIYIEDYKGGPSYTSSKKRWG